MFYFRDLQLFKRFQSSIEAGYGLASCPSLGLLATSDDIRNTISVWGVPLSSDCSDGGLVRMCTLGGRGSKAPMQFKFGCDKWASGLLAFTSAKSPPLLLVSDAGHDAVHIVDVVSQTHVGYVASPGSIAGPRGVAACGTSSLVAVSAWRDWDAEDHVVVVYSGSGAHWEAVRVIGGRRHPQFIMPFGLRFSADGSNICVAERGNDRISLLRVSDGEYVRHIKAGIFTRSPFDVEEVDGGWMVVCHNRLVCIHDDFRKVLFEFSMSAAATMPGLGVVVRHNITASGICMQVLSDEDTMSMWTMSGMRVVWMTVVARGMMYRCRR